MGLHSSTIYLLVYLPPSWLDFYIHLSEKEIKAQLPAPHTGERWSWELVTELDGSGNSDFLSQDLDDFRVVLSSPGRLWESLGEVGSA